MASPTIKTIQIGETVRYRWVVDIGADPVTGKRRQIRRTFDRRRNAQAELAKVLHEVNRRTFTVPAKTTLGEYLREWLRSATRGKEAATKRNYEDALRPVIERYGAVPLQKLTTTDVENLVDAMLTSGRKRGGKPGTPLSPRTVQLTLSRLRSALTDAQRRHLVAWNVAAPVKCPAQHKTPREPWTEHEVRAFLSSLPGQRLYAVMLLSLLGLRPAEVCGLRWPDVDLELDTLKVASTRTLVATDEGMVVVEKGPKSVSGRRVLPLPSQVTAALRAFRALQAREQLAAGPAYTATGYVLVDEFGAPCRTDWLRRRAYELMAAAGVRKVRLYDARHSTLTFMATNGVPDVIVSAWAGHADLSLAKRNLYAPDDKRFREGPRRAVGTSRLDQLNSVTFRDIRGPPDSRQGPDLRGIRALTCTNGVGTTGFEPATP